MQPSTFKDCKNTNSVMEQTVKNKFRNETFKNALTVVFHWLFSPVRLIQTLNPHNSCLLFTIISLLLIEGTV